MLLCSDIELLLEIIEELLGLLQVTWQSDGSRIVQVRVPFAGSFPLNAPKTKAE